MKLWPRPEIAAGAPSVPTFPTSRALHASRSELGLYVIDALTAPEKDRVEAHVLACAACAEALASEAQLESALEHVAALDPHTQAREARRVVAAWRPRRAWQHRAVGGAAGALAAAAAIVLALASNSARAEPAGAVARGASADADSVPMMSAGVIGEPDYEVALQPRDALDGG